MRWAGLFLQLIDEEAKVQSGQATNPRSQSSGGRASFRPKQAAQSRAWIKVPLWGAVRFSLFPRTQGHLSWSHCLGLAERQSAPGKPGHGSPRLGGWQSQSLCDYTHGGALQGPERLSNLSKVTQLTVGLMETWTPRPAFQLGSHTFCIQETAPGSRAHRVCCLGSHHLPSLGLAALQALTRPGCLPVTLGRDGSGFNNLHTLLPRLETPER